MSESNDMLESIALKMLQDLLQQGKLTQDKHDEYAKKFHRIHQTQMKSFQNQKVLPNKLKKMQIDIKAQKEQYEAQMRKHALWEDTVKKFNAEYKKAELEEDSIKKLTEQIQLALEKQRLQLQDIEYKIKEEKDQRTNKITPDIEQMESQKQKLMDEKKMLKNQIDQQQKIMNEQQERKNQLHKDNLEQKVDIEKLYNEASEIKDEPTRFQKKADMFVNNNASMQNDLKAKLAEHALKDKEIEQLKEKIEAKKSKIIEVEKQITELLKGIKDAEGNINMWKGKRNQARITFREIIEKRTTLDLELQTLVNHIRSDNDQVSSLKKTVENLKITNKKKQMNKQTLENQINETKMSIDKYNKQESEIKFEIKNQQDVKQNISDEAKLTEFKRRTVESKTLEKDERKKNLEKQISELESHLEKLQGHEVDSLKKVKLLTAMRESMARKASSAMNEVRETREELKIKELLILDLTKKHQETEFKLNSFKALYEEVKSARNKYVNLIQNASQDLAELKERIKILQNELEILKNESQEKDSTLMQYKHILQLEIHKRDRAHAKLNKFEYSRRSKKEQVDQNINEIEKLNMIIMALEKEMLLLKKNYEQACESRNYTGIQLIDRNDELCILYEKSNIQENILRNGETEIKKLEDEIRMIKIEMNEKKRQIDVSRKQILLVPVLADKVIELKNQLELEQEKEQKLSEELENPENIKRWRELKGQDPDQEALEAKIHVLEERLNNKKEQLLEKELILDEITNLSEKLRKQALEGRQSTLELSEKLNEFQARLKDITRKMMSSISELSMFQATAIKLQQERDELEKVVDEAGKRMEESLPPTPETEIEYLKSVRDRKRYEEEKQMRMQREALEKNFPPFATKTTAEHRVNAYIPDEIGIPKPYGKNAPFKPSEIGANFRHFRKPKINEIEI